MRPAHSPAWRCHVCGQAGFRNLGTRGYCVTHYEALIRTFAPESFALSGIGLTAGCLRPDYGEHYAELECIACGATWVGIAGQPCGWCARRRENQDRWQRDLLLTPPECDPDDAMRRLRLEAWADRLARGIDAGLITGAEARAAFDREVHRRGAA